MVRCIHNEEIPGECGECPPGRRALSFPEHTVGTAESAWVELVSLLAQVYDDQGILIWLCGEHARFGNRTALDMISSNKMGEVLAAADQLASGSFS